MSSYYRCEFSKNCIIISVILFFCTFYAVSGLEVSDNASPITNPEALSHVTDRNSSSFDTLIPDLNASDSNQTETNRSELLNQLANLPLSFIPNEGQTDKSVKFLVKSSGSTFFFTDDGVVMNAPGSDNLSAPSVIRQRFVHSDTIASVKGMDPLPGTAHYLTGRDPSAWKTNLTTYGSVMYENLYPGIDLIYRGKEGRLKREFIVNQGMDPSLIQIMYEGVKNITTDSTGGLKISTYSGFLFESPLICYQNISGKQIPVEGRYVIKDGTQVGFILGTYDQGYPVILDPDLVYSTFLGGSGSDYGAYDYDKGYGIAVENGYAYITGETWSDNFPTTPGSYSAVTGYYGDAFVTKLKPDGSGLEYSTFIGGQENAIGKGIAVENGFAYVTGETNDCDYPVTPGAYQATKKGSSDAFVTKLNPDGSGLIYSTFLGGTDSDWGNKISVDNGYAYITGSTSSSDYVNTTNAYQITFQGGDYDAFVTKLNPEGSNPVYSTYLGGSGNDYGNGIAVENGYAYITGETKSTNYPVTTGAYQVANKGESDAFVTKLNTGGTGLEYSTYIGGSLNNEGNAIAVENGYAYITGRTGPSGGMASTHTIENELNKKISDNIKIAATDDYPTTPGAYQSSNNGYRDIFVTKVNADGKSLVYSTYIGGSLPDEGNGIAIDNGNAYVTGNTMSYLNYPVTTDAFQTDGSGVYITKLNPSGSSILYSTLLGDSQSDEGLGIALDGGSVFVTGYTSSSNYPVLSGSFSTTFQGPGDAFVSKLNLNKPAPVAAFTMSTSSGTAPLTVRFTDTSTGNPTSWLWTFGDGGTSTVQSPSHQYTKAGTFTATLAVNNAEGQSTKSSTIMVKSGSTAPKITSIKPTSGQQGGKAAVTITGSNFEKNVVKVTVGNGVTIGKYKTRTTNKIVVPFTIAKTAKTGVRTVTVTNPSSGLKATKKFTISAAPKITKITPASGKQGKTVKVTITGKNFEKGKSTVTISGKGVSVVKYVTRNTDKIVANIKVASSAAATKRTVTVKNPTWGVTATAKTKFSVLKAKGTSSSQVESGSSISNGVLNSPVLSSSPSASSPKSQAQLSSGLDQVIPPAVL